MYSPELGRFLQVDPVGFYAGMNFYMYCGNNSLNWVDPSGLCKEKEGGKNGPGESNDENREDRRNSDPWEAIEDILFPSAWAEEISSDPSSKEPIQLPSERIRESVDSGRITWELILGIGGIAVGGTIYLLGFPITGTVIAVVATIYSGITIGRMAKELGEEIREKRRYEELEERWDSEWKRQREKEALEKWDIGRY